MSQPFPVLADRVVHEELDPATGRRMWCRPVDPDLDTPLVHHWMHQPHVVPFWDMAWPRDWITDYLRRHHEDPTRVDYVGFVDELPVGYFEVYDPHHDVLGAHHEVLPGDLGAHVLLGEEEYLGRYSVALGSALIRFLFQRPEVRRIVGEPDVENHNFLSLLAFLGFRRLDDFPMPGKTAAFMACTRRDFERLSSAGRRRRPPAPATDAAPTAPAPSSPAPSTPPPGSDPGTGASSAIL